MIESSFVLMVVGLWFWGFPHQQGLRIEIIGFLLPVYKCFNSACIRDFVVPSSTPADWNAVWPKKTVKFLDFSTSAVLKGDGWKWSCLKTPFRADFCGNSAYRRVYGMTVLDHHPHH